VLSSPSDLPTALVDWCSSLIAFYFAEQNLVDVLSPFLTAVGVEDIRKTPCRSFLGRRQSGLGDSLDRFYGSCLRSTLWILNS
jgi:hypothetical protein